MHDGIADVEITADFASVIDRANPYYVFLTPMGDTRGLYVSRQNYGGFQVRETCMGGRTRPSNTGSSVGRSAQGTSGCRLRRR
jgi:hypothetical protein